MKIRDPIPIPKIACRDKQSTCWCGSSYGGERPFHPPPPPIYSVSLCPFGPGNTHSEIHCYQSPEQREEVCFIPIFGDEKDLQICQGGRVWADPVEGLRLNRSTGLPCIQLYPVPRGSQAQTERLVSEEWIPRNAAEGFCLPESQSHLHRRAGRFVKGA